MNIFKAISQSVNTLSESDIDETRFYETIPGRGGSPDEIVLNIHGIRVLANHANISIIDVKELKQPKYDDKGVMIPSEYVVSATAEIITEDNDTRRDTSIVSQDTHYNAGRANPNFRETAVTRAKRNAILSLVPARYYLDKIVAITANKVAAKREQSDALALAKGLARSRYSAYLELTFKEQAQALWESTREEVLEEYGDEDQWGADAWNAITAAFDEALADGQDVEDQQSALDEEKTAQAAEQHLDADDF